MFIFFFLLFCLMFFSVCFVCVCGCFACVWSKFVPKNKMLKLRFCAKKKPKGKNTGYVKRTIWGNLCKKKTKNIQKLTLHFWTLFFLWLLGGSVCVCVCVCVYVCVWLKVCDTCVVCTLCLLRFRNFLLKSRQLSYETMCDMFCHWFANEKNFAK